MDFEWDDVKAATNIRKHGVSFQEASEVFGSLFAFTGDDIGHSGTEHRERTIGISPKGRVLVVITTRRGSVTRIISARKATTHEVQNYEQAIQNQFRRR